MNTSRIFNKASAGDQKPQSDVGLHAHNRRWKFMGNMSPDCTMGFTLRSVVLSILILTFVNGLISGKK